MRKNFKVAMIGLCAAIMLASCGNKENTEPTTETNVTTNTTQEQETATYNRNKCNYKYYTRTRNCYLYKKK